MDIHEFEVIDYSVVDHVATLRLNRPERRNSWTGQLALEYRWALAIADGDAEVGAIVVTGAGQHFCVGADRQILDDIDDSQGGYARLRADLPPFPEHTPEGLRHNHTYPLALRKPVIAAINGGCAGAGFVLSCYADFRVVAEKARITASFAGLGLPAEFGTGWILPRIVGLQAALEILMVNPVMSGAEALQARFALRCWPDDEFAVRVQEFAAAVAQRSSPAALAVMKRQVYVDAALDLETAYVRSVEDMNRMIGEPDFKEGLAALRGRRAPQYLPRQRDDPEPAS